MSKPIATFRNISDERWQAIFGTPEEQMGRRAKALAEQKQRELEQAEAVKNTNGLAVHGDALYTGFNIGLGEYCNGRTHTREIAKRLGKRAK